MALLVLSENSVVTIPGLKASWSEAQIGSTGVSLARSWTAATI